jgi:vacuolar-type H+-ATPase subunit I/STV1
MKLAVILGVIHMSFGIILKASNTLYFKKKLDFYFEFIPQIIFMVLIFGYMDFMIIFKWLKLWANTQDAPSIITLMINIPLKIGKTVIYLYKLGPTSIWWRSFMGHLWKYIARYDTTVYSFNWSIMYTGDVNSETSDRN